MSRIKFTDIPNRLRYRPNVKGILSTYHSNIIEYVARHFQDNRKYKMSVILLINQVSYVVYAGDSLPDNWSPSKDPFEPKSFWDNIYVDSQTALIKDIFVDYQDVDWNLEPVDNFESSNKINQDDKIQDTSETTSSKRLLTKDDLSIQPPIYSRFDVNKIWKSGKVDDTSYVIYESLPEIPTVQREISVTTDVNKMKDSDLIRLFPDNRIATRYSSLYTYVENMTYDNLLGCIPPIEGFTQEQVRDNIIRYPHFYKLKKEVNGEIVNFYNSIEIDGELYKIMDIWDDLPESKVIPKQFDFIKDYVVRRYLLERDIFHIDHKYKMYGTLDPFLTLFMSIKDYAELGYDDPLDLAKQCVQARISYKQSRNPVIRRLEDV